MLKDVEVVIIDNLTDDQIREYRLLDNKNEDIDFNFLSEEEINEVDKDVKEDTDNSNKCVCPN